MIVIPGGPVVLPDAGEHTHTYPAFQIPLEGATWQFSSSLAPSAGAHTHTVNPRFDTRVTYTFTAVPEPAPLALLPTLVIVFLNRRMRAVALSPSSM